MRIMLASHSASLEGGSERSLLEIVKYFIDKQNDEVAVITPGDGSLASALRNAGAEVFSLSYHWASTSTDTPAVAFKKQIDLSLSKFGLINKLITSYQPDIFITNTSVVPWFAYICKRNDIPHAWFIREKIIDNEVMKFYPDSTSYTHFIDQSSDVIFVNSKFTASLLENTVHKKKMTVVYPSIDSQILEYAHKKTKTDKTRVEVVTFGAVTRQKNQLEMLRALSLLKSKISIKYTILGPKTSADYYEILQEYITKHSLQDCVEFIDYMENPYEYVARCDIVVVPSLAEPFGRVTTEAMLLGVPVIANGAGGTPEIITNGKTGFIYEIGNPSDLAKKIMHVSEGASVEKIDDIVSAARKYARSEFTEDKAHTKMYEALLTATKRSKSLVANDESWVDASVYSQLEGYIDLLNENEHAHNVLLETRKSLDNLSKDYSDLIGSKKWKLASKLGSAAKKVKYISSIPSNASDLLYKRKLASSSFKLKTIHARNKINSRHDTVPVIMCLWKRTDRLHESIEQIDNQNFKDGSIHLLLWNNNPRNKNKIESIIKASRPNKAIGKISVYNSRNIGGFGRFYMAKKITNKNHPQPVIFLDDDQVISSTFIEEMLQHYQLNQLASFWAFRLNGSYWKRIELKDNARADYCGTGGMIADSSIFHDKGLYDCPEKYWFIEDLWLSFYGKYVKGWEIRKIDIDISFVDRDNDQGLSLVDLKDEFYRYLSELHR